MNSMIHIGNQKMKKDSALDAAEAIDKVFTSARENTMDQSTVVEALQALSKVAEIKDITFNNVSLTNNDPENKSKSGEDKGAEEIEDYDIEEDDARN